MPDDFSPDTRPFDVLDPLASADLETIRAAAVTWADKPNVWAAQAIPALCDKITELRAELEATAVNLAQTQAEREESARKNVYLRTCLEQARTALDAASRRG